MVEPLIGVPGQQQGGDGAGGGNIKETTAETFMADVVEESMRRPVIVDFWAPWCGPCKQLTPILEKQVNAAGGAVAMVKLNIDQNPDIAQQLRIQSIPAVYAFAGGRPVDGFVGVQSESEVKRFVDRLVQAGGGQGQGGDPIEDALAQAGQLAEGGDNETAAALYRQILEHDPDRFEAVTGLARALVDLGRPAEAKQALAKLTEADRQKAEVQSILSAIEVAEETAAAAGETDALERRLADSPDDHQARFDLAMAYYAAGRHEAAAEALLEIIRRDRDWNEGAARQQLLKFFEAWGPKSQLTASSRRRLSSILFA